MPHKPTPHKDASKANEGKRQKKLEQALRDNLKRRKSAIKCNEVLQEPCEEK
jgi:hypothetical protein